MNFPGGSDGKESTCNVGDLGSIPGLGRSSGEGNSNALQYSCLENPRDRGACWATVYGVSQSRTRLKRLSSSSSQYSCLENPMDRGAWWATVHGPTESDTTEQLSIARSTLSSRLISHLIIRTIPFSQEITFFPIVS